MPSDAEIEAVAKAICCCRVPVAIGSDRRCSMHKSRPCRALEWHGHQARAAIAQLAYMRANAAPAAADPFSKQGTPND